MKIFGIITGIIVGFMLIAGLFIMMNVASTKKTVVKYEREIVNLHKASESIHSKVWKKVKGIAKVKDSYAKDLKELTRNYVEGRKVSSDAMFVAAKEAIPTLDKEMYSRLMDVLEAGYEEFDQAQRRKLDLISKYERYLEEGVFVRPFIVSMLGYPKIDLEELGTVISTADTKEVFETKEDKEIDF